MNPAALYVPSAAREWFVRDVRGAVHQYDNETAAWAQLAANPDAVAVLYRDVVTGPLIEATRP